MSVDRFTGCSWLHAPSAFACKHNAIRLKSSIKPCSTTSRNYPYRLRERNYLKLSTSFSSFSKCPYWEQRILSTKMARQLFAIAAVLLALAVSSSSGQMTSNCYSLTCERGDTTCNANAISTASTPMVACTSPNLCYSRSVQAEVITG